MYKGENIRARSPRTKTGTKNVAQRPYWVISSHKGGYIETLTTRFGGVEVLPLFSFEEEADLFLSLGVFEEGWKVRRSGAGEILSLLHGPCSGVSGVALDPVPEINGNPILKLVTVRKEDFEAEILGVEPVVSFLPRSLPA